MTALCSNICGGSSFVGQLSGSPTNVTDLFGPAADEQPRSGKKNLAASAANSSFQNVPRQQLLRFLGTNRKIVVVTTEKLAKIPPQFGDLQTVFEGFLLECDEAKNITIQLTFQNGTTIKLLVASVIIRWIFPRQAEATRLTAFEACNFFNETGRCAFGPTCRKDHDPALLSSAARTSLRDSDSDVQLCRQQLTLHVAHVPMHVTEQDIIEEFSMFGEVSSVNFCKSNSLLSSGEDWRYAFVTFDSEKQALHAKTTLNEDPSSRWFNTIQFAKKVTVSPFASNDQSSTAREYKLPRWEVPALGRGNNLWLGCRTPEGKMLSEKELATNMQRFGATKSIKVDPKRRFAIVTFMQKSVAEAVKANADGDARLAACFAHQKPTAMIYLAKGPSRQVTASSVKSALASFDGLLDLQVQESGEYALAEFETQDDAVYAFHLLASKHAGEWILDFQHIDVRHRLRRHFQLYRQLVSKQTQALRSLEDAWSGGVGERQERASLLSSVQLELLKTDQTLTRMVVQALKQAMSTTQGQDGDSSTPKLRTLAEAIGTEAVQFCESKHESLIDFITAEIASDWAGSGGNDLRLRSLTEAACFDCVEERNLRPSPPRTPMLYRSLLSHVADPWPKQACTIKPSAPSPVPCLGPSPPPYPDYFRSHATLPRFARSVPEQEQYDMLLRPLAMAAA